MNLELWYLIAVPLLFSAGWILRGFDARQRKQEQQDLPDNYFKGLSLLLSNQPDQAIDAFIAVARVDSETIELHHALGNLFRKRGEFDRAIRIHSYLIHRADLTDKDRLRALSELAEDYLKAGIYDKATECYLRLSQTPEYAHEALVALLQIRCTEHDWRGAIEVARELEKDGKEDKGAEISHFRCEIAQELVKAKKPDEAFLEVERALQARPDSPRALMLAGDLLMRQGRLEEAIASWEKVGKVAMDHFPLVAGRIVEALEVQGNLPAAKAVLNDALSRFPTAEIVGLAMQKRLKWDGAGAATAVVSQSLKTRPSLGILSIAMDLRNRLNPEDQQLQSLTEMLRKESDRQGRFQCRCCGFLSHSYLWQCPGCGQWDTYPTVRVQDLQAMKK